MTDHSQPYALPSVAFGPVIYAPIEVGKKSQGAFGERLQSLRSLLINLLFIAAFLILVPLAADEIFRENVIIEPIELPQYLEDMGYSGDVAASRLWDAINEINKDTTTSKERANFTPQSLQTEVSIPETGVSLKSLGYLVRRFLNVYDTRIAGEFICPVLPCTRQHLYLKLRIIAKANEIVALPPIGRLTEAEYFHNAALIALQRIDPYVVASYLFHRDRKEALRIARDVYFKGGEFAKWGTLLYCNAENDTLSLEEIADWCKRALELDPTFHLAYYNWGMVLRSRGDPDGAIEKYSKVIEIQPNYVDAYNNWGNALRDKRDADGAIEKYKKVIEIDPKYARAYNNWGNVLREIGKPDIAIEKYKKVVEIDPNYFDAYNNWGDALADKGDRDGAIKMYARVLDVDPRNARAYCSWGNALLDMRSFDEAIEKYKKVIEVDPTYARAYKFWGDALRDRRDPRGAAEKYRKAIEIDPDYSSAKSSLGTVISDAGDPASVPSQFTRYSSFESPSKWSERLRDSRSPSDEGEGQL